MLFFTKAKNQKGEQGTINVRGLYNVAVQM